MTIENDRRLTRPRISVGSMIGFGTLISTSLVGIVGAAMWVGGLDRTVSDLAARVERDSRDNAAFVTEMRATLLTISGQVTQARLDIAGKPNATRRR